MLSKVAVACSILFALFMARIVYLADTGQSFFLRDLANSTPYGDKIGHFLLFGFFALILNIAFRGKTFKLGPLVLPLGVILLFGIVVAEELSQVFFPSRSCDLTDLVADFAGMIAFSLLFFLLFPKPKAEDPA